MEGYFIALRIIVSYGKKENLIISKSLSDLKSTLERHFYIYLTQYLIRTEIDQRTVFT